MGTLTLTQLKTEVRSGLGGRTDLDTRLAIILNIAQMRINRKYRWEELERITSGTLTYNNDDNDRYVALPTSTRDIHSFVVLSGANSRKLDGRTTRQWDAFVAKPEYFSRHLPSDYVRYKDRLEIFRMPDQAYSYRIRHDVWASAFSDASPSVTSDLDHKDDLLIALALSYSFSSLGDSTRASRWWVIYSNGLNDAVGEEVEKPDIAPAPQANLRDWGSSSEPWKDPFIRG